MRKTIPLIIIILFFILVASAYGKNQQIYGNLVCKFIKNYDGDTIRESKIGKNNILMINKTAYRALRIFLKNAGHDD